MDPKIRNFQVLARQIRERPREADRIASAWFRFVQRLAPRSPELSLLRSFEEFNAWADAHRELLVDRSVWVGKEISDAYFYLRERHEQRQMEEGGGVAPDSIPADLIAPPFLNRIFQTRPKIFEEDEDYQKTARHVATEWLKNNKKKSFFDNESGLDYLYGSLEDKDAPTLQKDARAQFSKNEKLKDRIERYEKEAKKVYKKLEDDPRVKLLNRILAEEIEARIALAKKQKLPGDQISSVIKTSRIEHFVREHPEKAEAYSEKDVVIKQAYQRYEQVRIAKRAPRETASTLWTPSPKPKVTWARPQFTPRPSPRIAVSTAQASTRIAGAGLRAAGAGGRIAVQAGAAGARAGVAAIGFLGTVGAPFWIALGLIIGLTFFIVIFSNGNLGDVPGVFENIEACEFVRDSSRTTPPPQKGKIKSAILAGWMSNVAAKAGIPASVLASVATVESASFTLKAIDEHDAIKNNYYYLVSQANQGINKETNAVGVAQISTGKTPQYDKEGNFFKIIDHCQGLITSGVFKSAADKIGKKIHDEAGDGGLSYYCVSDTEERIKKFCQTNNTTKNSAIYEPDSGIDDSYFNLCRIQDNLMISAEKLKADIGDGDWNKEQDLNKAVSLYYGTCEYPTGNYCTEVESGYKNCSQLQTARGQTGNIAPTGVGGERIANAAKQIAEQLVSSDDFTTLQQRGWTCDQGGTFGRSFHCWDPEEMRYFDQGHNPGYLECTEFVWAAFKAAGFEEEIKLIKNPDAYEWVNSALRNPEAQQVFQIIHDPRLLQPGDIISSGEGIGSDGLPWGHVAIVVERIDNTITVAQASTSKALETWAIKDDKLISPVQSRARAVDTIRGFFRLTGKKTP